MIKVIIFDFSKVLLFPKDRTYQGSLNELNNKLSSEPNYKASDHFELNMELVEYIKSTLKGKYKLVLYTSETIQNEPEFKQVLDQIFDNVISAKEIGYAKSMADGYRYICKSMGILPEEVLFVDDSKVNRDGAEEAGIETLEYTDNESLKRGFDSLLFDD